MSETITPNAALSASPYENAILIKRHRHRLWPHYANLLLGLWLVISPMVFDYRGEFIPDANVLRVISEHDLPSLQDRNYAMFWSDVISGVLIIIFSILSSSRRRRFPWAQWANGTVGVWLLFAPIIFWTPMPEIYANSTFIGAAVVTFALIVAPMPGMSVAGIIGGPDIPPGWAYTPASWPQRLPIATLSLFGFFISYYMASYQLGHIDRVWDPFFGNGTMKIITSDISRAWPISDAGLGAVAYILEFLMTIMGGRNRWRTMPWMVLGLGILIVPLGGVSIFFIIIQPILIGTWCTLCLIAAVAMILMVAYSLDEIVATGQFLVDAYKKRKPFWRTFWTGDTMEGGSENITSYSNRKVSVRSPGSSLPIALILSTALGMWLMFTRLVFDTTGTMANSDHLVGALVVTFSIIALAEVSRSIRFINILLGAWLVMAPWVIGGGLHSTAAIVNSVLCGIVLCALAIPRGPIKDSYGNWDPFIV